MESEEIPSEVTDVLKTANIGYLTTISKKGELYTYPVTFYYSSLRVYFVTPASAAKYKMIKENPTVSLIVDNKQLTINACGAMIQGLARTFSVTRTILSILSLGPKVAGFSKKYPGMLTFYAKGKRTARREEAVQVPDHSDQPNKDSLLDRLLVRKIHRKEG